MQNQRPIQKIDAAGQAPGRLAAQIATFLIGKHRPDYQPNVDSGDFVRVENASQMKFTGKKMDQKMYRSHSGAPRGLKETLLKKLWAKDPSEVLRHAVSRMLPKNKLRNERLKRLEIKN
ncbi:50S ribosomal protein L13 [Patescibacteria group bacterium]|nr:50S ribosomal protein L13 [Patescibacteria group bacterium]MBU1705397.1 50S ribosomal protein L13 [Patescibacteria group bacterium]